MIDVLGILHHADETEFRRAERPFDAGFVRDYAQAYERAGYDGVLIGQNARSPDSLTIAAYVASCTTTLKFLIAHRPGFVVPTMAARMFATVDRLSGGRAIAHIITASIDIETQCDGDFLTKVERYERSLEYVEILRRIWSSDVPVDHAGATYAFAQGFCDARPLGGAIPISWGGASELGVAYGARCADTYAMGGRTLESTAALVAEVREAACAYGRAPRFCMSLRVILGADEADAWRRARAVLEAIVDFQATGGVIGRDKGEADRAAMREAEAAAATPDPHLWTSLTTATGGRTHITALVGSSEQLAAALGRYHALGIDSFILTGFDPIADTVEIGRDLIPRLKALASSASRVGEG